MVQFFWAMFWIISSMIIIYYAITKYYEDPPAKYRSVKHDINIEALKASSRKRKFLSFIEISNFVLSQGQSGTCELLFRKSGKKITVFFERATFFRIFFNTDHKLKEMLTDEEEYFLKSEIEDLYDSLINNNKIKKQVELGDLRKKHLG